MSVLIQCTESVLYNRQVYQVDASRILTKLLEGKTMDDIIKAMNDYEKILSPEHKNRKSIYFSD